MSNPVELLKSNADEIKAALQVAGQPSLLISAEDALRRNVLIAAASFFEYELCRRIELVFSNQDCTSECMSLLRSKAINRQFYNYFDFKSDNTNRLFSAFGPDCKDRASKAVRASSDLMDSQRSFLEICSLRNNMIHENFSIFPMDISTDDVYIKFQSGLSFLDFFEEMIGRPQAASPL